MQNDANSLVGRKSYILLFFSKFFEAHPLCVASPSIIVSKVRLALLPGMSNA